MNLIWLEDILVPLGICVALPVLLVWLVTRARQNEMNRKTEVMLKAIEAGVPVDADFFRSKKNPATIKEKLLNRLTGASVTSLLGLAFIAVGIFIGIKFGDSINGGVRSTIYCISVGGLLLAIGIALFIVYSFGKKLLAKEIEAEEKTLEQK